jgi:hypothetical protein
VTVIDLVTRAMARIGSARAGDVVAPDDMQLGFDRLNDMIDSWALERLMIPFTSRTTFPIVSGTQNYTVGSGGTVNIARPPLPNDLVVKFQDTSTSPSTEYSLSKLTDAAWQAIPQKGLTSTLPTAYYYSNTYASGFGTLSFWMVPTATTLQGVVYAPTALSEYALPTDTVTVPQGYRLALIDNLAILLAPDFGQPVSPELLKSARASKDLVRVSNLPMMDLSVDPALTYGQVRYSILTDGTF